MKMKCSQILLDFLLEGGVVYSAFSGGTILNIYDELGLHGYKEKIRHILTAHEQGRPTPPTATPVPPARWACASPPPARRHQPDHRHRHRLLTPPPVVFITCNVSENLIGKDSFQEVDITGISMPITKCNYLVTPGRRTWPT